MDESEIKRILGAQLQLLADYSRRELPERELLCITEAMVKVATLLITFSQTIGL